MLSTRLTLFSCSLLVAACGRRELTLSPPDHQGLVSALYVITTDRGEHLQGGPLDGATTIEVPSDPTEILALLYSASVEELQVGPGPLPEATASASRAVPEPTRVDRYDLDAETWEEVSLERVAALRLPPFDYQRCIAADGCSPSDGSADRCQLPCPSVVEPALPMPPASVCPTGWIEAADLGPGGVQRCLPPFPARVECPRGEYQPIDSTSCVRIGPACRPGRFPDLAAEIRPVLYVDPTAAPGGDGSLAQPYSDLGVAYQAAAPGSVLALSRGDHPLGSPLFIGKDIEVRGACAEGTSILTAGTTFEVQGATFKARDLAFAGQVGVYSVVAGSRVELEGVLIDPGEASGVYLGEPTIELDLRRTVITGRGLRAVAIDAGSGTIEDVAVVDSGEAGIFCRMGSVQLARTRIVGTKVVPVALRAGNGLEVGDGCTMTGSGLVSEYNQGNGVVVNTGRFELTDLLIRSSGQEGNAETSIGLLVLLATAALDRVAILGAVGGGIHTVGSNVELTDLVVTDVADEMVDNSLAVQINEGTRGRIRRARIERTIFRAVYVNSGRPFALEDFAVEGVRLEKEENNPATVALNGKQISVDRMLVDGGVSTGIAAVSNVGTILRDVSVSGAPIGMLLGGLGGIRVERALLEDNFDYGLEVDRVACVSLEERRCFDSEIDDLTVRGTRLGQLQPAGVEVTSEAQLAIRSFLVEDNAGAGVRSLGGKIELSNGIIRRNPIGLEVPTGADFLSKALSGVHLEGNQHNLRLADP